MSRNYVPRSEDLKVLNRRINARATLPSVYDDALSYQNLIYKLMQYLEDGLANIEDWNVWLDGFVSTFDAKLQDTVRDKIQDLYDSGKLAELTADVIAVVQDQIDDVQDQINDVDSKIDNQIDDVNSKIENVETNYHEMDNRVSLQLEQIVTNVNSFSSIQNAIDYVHSQGKGKVLLPSDREYNLTENLYIKEGVHVEGNGSIINVNLTAQIIFYNDAQLNGLVFNLPSDYNRALFWFDNGYLTRTGRRHPSIENALVKVYDFQIISPYSSITPNKTAFGFYSNRQVELTKFAGFWGVDIRNGYIDGCNIIANLTTEGTGWLTGNFLENVTGDYFDHAVVVNKSTESLDVSNNVFKRFKLQTRPNTKDIFMDNTDANAYIEPEIYDMFKNLDARLGNVKVIDPINLNAMSKQKYGHYLSGGSYYLLGRFKRFSSPVHNVRISFKSTNNFYNEYVIKADSESQPHIERIVYGDNRWGQRLKFYIKRLLNNEVELYLYSTAETFVSMYFEGVQFFAPSINISYDIVDNLSEITDIIEYEVSNHTNNVNNFDLLTPLEDFPLGRSRTVIDSNNPTVGLAPGGNIGTLITEIVNKNGQYGYSFQEYHVFNSEMRETYKRHGVSATEWNVFVKTSRDAIS